LRYPTTSPIKLRWRAIAVRHCFGMFPGESILEIGAGSGLWTGHLTEVLRGENPITAAVFDSDLARSANARAMRNVSVVSIHSLAADLSPGSFDYIVGTAVLCHKSCVGSFAASPNSATEDTELKTPRINESEVPDSWRAELSREAQAPRLSNGLSKFQSNRRTSRWAPGTLRRSAGQSNRRRESDTIICRSQRHHSVTIRQKHNRQHNENRNGYKLRLVDAVEAMKTLTCAFERHSRFQPNK